MFIQKNATAKERFFHAAKRSMFTLTSVLQTLANRRTRPVKTPRARANRATETVPTHRRMLKLIPLIQANPAETQTSILQIGRA